MTAVQEKKQQNAAVISMTQPLIFRKSFLMMINQLSWHQSFIFPKAFNILLWLVGNSSWCKTDNGCGMALYRTRHFEHTVLALGEKKPFRRLIMYFTFVPICVMWIWQLKKELEKITVLINTCWVTLIKQGKKWPAIF